MNIRRTLISVVLFLFIILSAGCSASIPPDEALQRAREADDKFSDLGPSSAPGLWKEAAVTYYPPAEPDYFEDMDAFGQTGQLGTQSLKRSNEEGEGLSIEAVKGRNAWVMWTAGNEAWWDWLARHGYGSVDLLKLIDDRNRETRFARSGLINEPGTRPPTPEETEDAFGVRYARPVTTSIDGLEVHVEYREDRPPPDPKVYGYPTGVVGLRIFPNPDFRSSAQRQWNPELYYAETAEGRAYARRPDTIRPFRVGMSCGYCHIAPHPLRPPSDPEFPKWNNLSNNIGNQYMRTRSAFGNTLRPKNFLFQVFDSYLPGAVDTSGHPSDNNNNPNTVNSIFGLRGRLERMQHTPREKLSPDTHNYLSMHTNEGSDLWNHLPRVLLDGSDSVGVNLALARVYLNIGTHHQQWIRTINPLLGFYPQRPFKLKDIAGNSLYWHATNLRVGPMATFFLASTAPMRLKDVRLTGEDGKPIQVIESRPASKPPRTLQDYLKQEDHLRGTGLPWYTATSDNGSGSAEDDPPIVGGPGNYSIGRQVFAGGCIACHSSVQPGDVLALEETLIPGDDTTYLKPLRESPPADWVGDRETWERLMDGLLKERRRLRLTDADRAQLARGDGRLPSAYAEWAKLAVEQPEFWEYQGRVWDMKGEPVLDEEGSQQLQTVHNFLSIDERLPVTIPGTNSGRAAATNSMSGQVWHDFSSETFKHLGPSSRIEYRDRFSGATRTYHLPGDGPGYYRVPTLISIWATAPFLHNNSLGTFNNDPSVAGRLSAFDDAIQRLLWPDERRTPSKQVYWTGEQAATTVYDAWYPGKDASIPVSDHKEPGTEDQRLASAQRERDSGWIARTTRENWFMFDGPHVPMLVGGVVGLSREQMRVLAWVPALVFLVLGVALLLKAS